MERAFQTALWLLKPEIVFILGDIFDEGKWSSQKVTLLSMFCRATVFVMVMALFEVMVRRTSACMEARFPARLCVRLAPNSANTDIHPKRL